MSQLKDTSEEKRGNVIHMTQLDPRESTIQHVIPIWYIKTKNIIYYILGLLEVLLGLRFIFMLLGANPKSGFTSFLYAITGIFIAPFSGIFIPLSTIGLASRSVLDPATVIAMAIYALVAWGIVRLLWIQVSKEI